jgi:uncharacterized protein (DUF2147 family)
MRTIAALLIVHCSLVIGHCFSQLPADKILGTYLTQDKSSKVEFYKSNNKYFGKIVWLKNPDNPKTNKPDTDTENPDPAKRNNPIMGLVLIQGISFHKNCWDGGIIYDPTTGKTWDCSVSFDGSNLKVKGFWKFSLFGKTEIWTKA